MPIPRIFRPLLSVAVALPAFVQAQSYTVFDNNLLRIGNGGKDSVMAASGILEQPFYFSDAGSEYYRLTFSDYSLDLALGAGGDGANIWNVNGTILDVLNNWPVEIEGLSDVTVDDSGHVSTEGGDKGYGVLISEATATFGEAPDAVTLQVRQRYELPSDKAFIKVTTSLTNPTESTVTNVRAWVGTQDDYVGTTDEPTNTRGNIIDGAFVALTNKSDQARAIQIASNDEAVLFYTTDNSGYAVLEECCQFYNVYLTDPADSAIEFDDDGSYGLYFRFEDLAPGATQSAVWYYAAGDLEDLAEIIEDIEEDEAQDAALPATPVPAIPLWALIVLAGGAGVAGIRRLRRAT